MAPGKYSAELFIVSATGARRLGGPQSFEVKPVPNALPGTDYLAVAAFQQETADLMRRINAVGAEVDRVRDRLRHLQRAAIEAPRAAPSLVARLDSLTRGLAALDLRLRGDPARRRLNESAVPSIEGLVGEVIGGHWETRQAPTGTQRKAIEVAAAEFATVARGVAQLIAGDLARIEADLEAAGAPATPGRRIPIP
jgi:hypothetical protein